MDNYTKGFIDALHAYAWWKHGEQYVGTTGTPLDEAIQEVKEGTHFNYNPPKGEDD